MITKKKPERRKKRVIDPVLQHRLVGRVGGLALFYFLFCVTVSVVLPVMVSLVTGDRQFAMQQVSFRTEVLLEVMLAPMVVTFVALWLHGIQESSRVAGPTYRFRRVFQQLGRLCIPRGVRIRKDDHMHEAAADLNGALQAMHGKVGQLKNQVADLREEVRKLASEQTSVDLSAVRAAVRDTWETVSAFNLVNEEPLHAEDPVGPEGGTPKVEQEVSPPRRLASPPNFIRV